MKYFIIILSIVLLSSCQTKKSKIGDEDFNSDQLSEAELIELYFDELEIILENDSDKFWNKKLYGPILIVDPEKRTFYANENNAYNSFKQIGTIYTDTLPKEINIANTAIDWDDKSWTMLISPLPEEKHSRNNLFIHELFHRIQPEIGFDKLTDQSNSHLDLPGSRILLKLELESLKKALTDETERNIHIKNAFVFRLQRYINDKIKNAENSLELNEGLAEYTGVMLSGRPGKELASHFIKSINLFYQNPTFVRSFAYHTTPVYGYLLSLINKSWHKNISQESNLTDYSINAFDIEIPADLEKHSLANRDKYNYKMIVEQENAREKERLVKVEQYKNKYIEKPTLRLLFENMNISFDPRNIMPLEDYGTVYPNIRVTDNWGILTVNNGALLSTDWSNIIVSEPTEINENLVKGDGWTLELKQEWRVEKLNGKYELRK